MMRRSSNVRLCVTGLLVLLALGMAACGDDDGSGGEVTVFAAASLTDVFQEIGEAFEAEHDDTGVTFNFASSSSLAVQITQGAPADVFASANETQMGVVIDDGAAEGPTIFATNELVIVTPAGNETVRSFETLAADGVRLVLAAPDVPVGNFAREMLKLADEQGSWGDDFSERVLANVVSNETDVRAVLTKVQLDEADAGIVYRTDVAAGGGDVTSVEIPADVNVVATYPIAVISDSSNEDGARAFMAFVLSEEGQALLEDYGFGSP